ncbi:MAG: metallophosphoesterase [Candidatus Nanopelagicales bacterium]
MRRFSSRQMLPLLLVGCLAGAGAAGTATAATDPAAPTGSTALYPAVAAMASGHGVVTAYTLIVPRSAARHQLQARAIIPRGVTCPDVRAVKNGRVRHLSMTMRVPGATTGAAFANLRACQANLPTGLTSATVAGHTVPAALPDRFRKLVLIGDTGCRVDEDLHQDCADPARWPLARNSRSVAREKADALVFTGDFYYREAPCENTPTDDTVLEKCGGSPAPVPGMDFRDTDYGWLADVFVPMAPILRTTPLLIVRGNHEECRRAGNGYALFLDSSPLGAASCAPDPVTGETPKTIEPTWSFDLPITANRTLRAVVVDSSGGKNLEVSPWVAEQRPGYRDAARLSRPVKAANRGS